MRPSTPSSGPAAFALALCLLAGPATGQDQTGADPTFPVSIRIQLGYGFGGPAPGLVDAYRAAGYGDESPGGCLLGSCFGGIQFPHTERIDRPEIAARLSVRLHPRWSVAVAGGIGPAGIVEGYDAQWSQNGVNSATSAIHYGAQWLGAALQHHYEGLRLGLGPAVEHTSWTADWHGVPDEPTPESVVRPTTVRAGFVAEAALTVATLAVFSAEVVARYRDGGRVRVTDLHDNLLTTHSRTFFIGLGVGTR